MKRIERTSQFKKDVKKSARQKKNIQSLKKVVSLLASGKILDKKYSDHKLTGEYRDCRECHISGDWLLIYMADSKVLKLVRLGSHAELF